VAQGAMPPLFLVDDSLIARCAERMMWLGLQAQGDN
jgi:hypothetical protein